MDAWPCFWENSVAAVLIVLLEKERSLLVQPISFCLLSNSQSGSRKEKKPTNKTKFLPVFG